MGSMSDGRGAMVDVWLRAATVTPPAATLTSTSFNRRVIRSSPIAYRSSPPAPRSSSLDQRLQSRVVDPVQQAADDRFVGCRVLGRRDHARRHGDVADFEEL